MASEVNWERPQPGVRTPRSWDDALEAVRARPGEWARVATYRGETSAYKAAQKLRRSPSLAGEAGSWEVAARRLPEGGSALYARYRPPVAVGGGSPFGGDAPQRAHAALRALVTSTTPDEAAAVLAAFVEGVGGRVVPFDDASAAAAGAGGDDVVPLDVSLGEGPPVAAAAPRGSVARAVLEELLPPLVEDAQRLLALRRAAARGGSPVVGEMGIDPSAAGTARPDRGGHDPS